MIRLDHVYKGFNGNAVLEDISLALPEKGFCAITGRSGRGKTTLLYLIAGLYKPDRGSIQRNGETISMVFQEDRLCDALTPVSNIRLVTPSLDEEQVLSAMQAVGLRGCEKQPCRELSGGMRRRVALLRALMANYDILFLDEPFKGLDEETKTAAIYETRRRCQGCTVLLVTHDPTEIDAMGVDQVICL